MLVNVLDYWLIFKDFFFECQDNKRILQTILCQHIWKLDEMDKFLEKNTI